MPHLSRKLVAIATSIALASSVTVAAEPTTGTIHGAVRFTGKLPEPKSITVADGSTLKHSDLVVDKKSQGLRDVVVILADAPDQPRLKEAKPVVVDQKEWVFRPRVVAVQDGQAVRFDNSDTVNHSVMAISTEAKNSINTVAGPGTPVTHTFVPQKTPVLIGCSLHGWMRAWVVVVRHPWFAVTDTQGKFTIRGVPPGKYTLAFHHPDTNLRATVSVEVVAGKSAEATVEWKKTGK